MLAWTAIPLALLTLQGDDARGVGVLRGAEDAAISDGYRRRHAIVIGIDDYADPTFPDLRHAVVDARAVADVLVEGFGFARTDVRLLLDEAATRRAISEALEDWASAPERVLRDDLLVFYFAGHGIDRSLGERGKRGYLVPVDGRRGSGTTPVWSSLIGMDDLSSASETVPAKHALFLLDCCFGGLSIMRHVPASAVGLRSRARQVLTAGSGEQVVQDAGGGGHSVFAGALLEALSGRADADEDRVISFGELFTYVARRVHEGTRSRQTPLQGTLPDHGGGSVALFLTAPGTRPTEPPSVVAADASETGAGELLRSLLSASGLSIVPRDAWAARPPDPDRMDSMGGIRRLTLHHSGVAEHGRPSPGGHSDREHSAGILRSVQRTHMDERRYGDIGYHFAIDAAGRVWECRSTAYRGAHAGGVANNEGNLGIVVLGAFEDEPPSPSQLTAVVTLIAFLRNRYAIPAEGVLMHSDLRTTACPGRQLVRLYRAIFEPGTLSDLPDEARRPAAAAARPRPSRTELEQAGILQRPRDVGLDLTLMGAFDGERLTESGRRRLELVAEVLCSDACRDLRAWIIARDDSSDASPPRALAAARALAALEQLVVAGGVEDERCVVVGRASTPRLPRGALEILALPPSRLPHPGPLEVLAGGERLRFASLSATVEREALAEARRVAAVLSDADPDGLVWIVGHDDDAPLPRDASYATKRELSVARARAVLDVLVDEDGVLGGRCAVVGYAAYAPSGGGGDRCVEILSTPP